MIYAKINNHHTYIMHQMKNLRWGINDTPFLHEPLRTTVDIIDSEYIPIGPTSLVEWSDDVST